MINGSQYPDEFIDPYKKNEKAYCLQYAMAFDSSSNTGLEGNLFRKQIENYEEWEKLASGKQDPQQYLKIVGVKSGRGAKSWKALDTAILPIAPKFVELLVGKIISKGYDSKGFRRTTVKGIDRKSSEEESLFKAGLTEQMINKDFIQSINQSGVNIPTNTDGTPVPDSMKEVDTFTKLFRKDEYALEAKDAMIMWFNSNGFEQSMYECVSDLVKLGDGGIMTDLDVNGNVKIKKIDPYRVITNPCKKKDFSDLYRFGEYSDITISQLRYMWPGQSEETYRKIAETSNKQSYGSYSSNYEVTGYPYDKEKITILHVRWISTDTWTHVELQDNYGGKRIIRKPFNFPTDRKGNEINLNDYHKRHPNKNVVKTKLENVYQCKWIVGTDECFDFGLVNNIQRTKNSLYGANLGVFLYHIENNIIEKIRGVINMCQVSWLQHQNHVARSKPNGISIEMSALEGLASGKNKDTLTVKEALRLYFDTGIVLWRRKNFSNASNQFRPIEELNNNVSNDAEKHLSFIFQYVNLLRMILGINEVEDASTPNPQILKGVAELAAIGTNNALKDLYQAVKSIYERTAKSVIDITPDARMVSKHKGFENALGKRSDEFWKEMGIREMGIIIDEGPDVAQKQVLENAINKSVDAGLITPDEGAEFLLDDNLIRAGHELRDKINMRQKEKEESEMRLRTHESQMNIASANAATEARIGEIKGEYEAKKDFEAFMTHQEQIRKATEFNNDIIKIKLEKGLELTSMEEEHLNKMEEISLKGEIDINKERVKSNKPYVTSK